MHYFLVYVCRLTAMQPGSVCAYRELWGDMEDLRIGPMSRMACAEPVWQGLLSRRCSRHYNLRACAGAGSGGNGGRGGGCHDADEAHMRRLIPRRPAQRESAVGGGLYRPPHKHCWMASAN